MVHNEAQSVGLLIAVPQRLGRPSHAWDLFQSARQASPLCPLPSPEVGLLWLVLGKCPSALRQW
jgi:hypothetical protein